jgi:hypothetical protein
VVDVAAVTLGDLERVIGGTGVDKDDFMGQAIGLLLGDTLQQLVEVNRFVECSKDDAHPDIGQIEVRGRSSSENPGFMRRWIRRISSGSTALTANISQCTATTCLAPIATAS